VAYQLWVAVAAGRAGLQDAAETHITPRTFPLMWERCSDSPDSGMFQVFIGDGRAGSGLVRVVLQLSGSDALAAYTNS